MVALKCAENSVFKLAISLRKLRHQHVGSARRINPARHVIRNSLPEMELMHRRFPLRRPVSLGPPPYKKGRDLFYPEMTSATVPWQNHHWLRRRPRTPGATVARGLTRTRDSTVG